MKGLLLDQGLPRSTASLLVQSGFTAFHAAEVGLSKASDSEILEYARGQDLLVVTLDADFHMLLATSVGCFSLCDPIAATQVERPGSSHCHQDSAGAQLSGV
jgi:predicted nuclease of predicted toxin-antitoxin system